MIGGKQAIMGANNGQATTNGCARVSCPHPYLVLGSIMYVPLTILTVAVSTANRKSIHCIRAVVLGGVLRYGSGSVFVAFVSDDCYAAVCDVHGAQHSTYLPGG